MPIQLKALTTRTAYEALGEAADLLHRYAESDPGFKLAVEAKALLARIVESYDGAPPPVASPVADVSLPAASKCRSCQAPIVWTRTTPANKPMPIDVEASAEGRFIVVGETRDDRDRPMPTVRALGRDENWHGPRFTSHFATCEFADQHRNR